MCPLIRAVRLLECPLLGDYTVAQSKQEFLMRSKFFHYMGGVGVVVMMGCGKSKSFVQGDQ